LAVTDWRLRQWRLWFLALSHAPHGKQRKDKVKRTTLGTLGTHFKTCATVLSSQLRAGKVFTAGTQRVTTVGCAFKDTSASTTNFAQTKVVVVEY